LPGKLPLRLLEKYVFPRIGVRDSRVVVGPGIGEDAAIIDLGGRFLIVHADPITEAAYRVGWLAVHIASNDIAVRGAAPLWVIGVILLPEDYSEGVLDHITRDMDEAARELGAMIIGGHTEETPRLDRPIVVCTVMGLADRYVSTSGARPGDKVLLIGWAGLEGTAVLASDFRNKLLKLGVSEDVLRRAEGLYRRISIVKPALRLAEFGASSMHDPTEGGLIGGLVEVAAASRVRIEVWERRIPLLDETRIIADKLGIDPLKLISSGALIATIPEERVKDLGETGINYSIIGEIHEGEPRLTLHRINGETEIYYEPPEDELARLWGKMRRK